MRILLLSDLHIARNTPWGKDWEDYDFLIDQLQKMTLPDFDMSIICGDTFNTPRIYQGDVVRFFKLLETLGVKSKPCVWINGNHDPGSSHVVQTLNSDVQEMLLDANPVYDDNWGGVVSLDLRPFMGIAGHSHCQDISVIRDFLKKCDCQITVTHQSAAMFMKGYNLDQLLTQDFHAELNIIGDTHITSFWQEEGVVCVSPGILVPMRSRSELVDADPRLVWFEADYLGDGRWDLEHASFDTLSLPKRPFFVADSRDVLETELQRIEEDPNPGKLPVIAFVEDVYSGDVPKKLDPTKVRVIYFSKNMEIEETPMEFSVDLGGNVTVETMLTAVNKLIPEDSGDRSTVLELCRSLLSNEDHEEVVKNYLTED